MNKQLEKVSELEFSVPEKAFFTPRPKLSHKVIEELSPPPKSEIEITRLGGGNIVPYYFEPQEVRRDEGHQLL